MSSPNFPPFLAGLYVQTGPTKPFLACLYVQTGPTKTAPLLVSPIEMRVLLMECF